MKLKIKRTKTELLDDVSIFCFNLRKRGEKLEDIAEMLLRHHSTVIYHLNRYVNRLKFSKDFRERINFFNEEYFLKKYREQMNLSQLLKNRTPANIPVSAQFIETKRVEPKPLIKPLAGPEKYNEKDRDKVEKWLTFCAIGTQIIDTGTKMLAHKKLIHARDGVFDLITAFKQLNKHFTGNEKYDLSEMVMEDFIFSFLTGSEEHQKRVIKFQESLINKQK